MSKNTPKKRTKTEERTIKVRLNETEIVSRARDLSKVLTESDDLESAMKSQASTYKDQIKAKQVEARRLSQVVKTGEEEQEKEVVIEFHTPVVGLKRTSRKDTGEEISVEKMSDYECQDVLDFVDEAEDGSHEESAEEEGDEERGTSEDAEPVEENRTTIRARRAL
jgi:hypothetical protein